MGFVFKGEKDKPLSDNRFIPRITVPVTQDAGYDHCGHDRNELVKDTSEIIEKQVPGTMHREE